MSKNQGLCLIHTHNLSSSSLPDTESANGKYLLNRRNDWCHYCFFTLGKSPPLPFPTTPLYHNTEEKRKGVAINIYCIN